MAFGLLSSGPGDGGDVAVAGGLTKVVRLGAPSPAQGGKWIRGVGLRKSLRYALSDLPSGVRVSPPPPPQGKLRSILFLGRF